MTDTENAIDDFIELFTGRTDAYGSWTGGRIDASPDEFTNPLCDHLYTGPYIGVYPITDDNCVRWGCVDIDGKDFDNDWDRMWSIGTTILETLAYKNITAWTERTAHGIHVWLFSDGPVPATIMRRALLVTCEVADYQPKEVNPKQDVVSPEKPLGNYVRIPYYGYLVHGVPKDRFVVDEDGPMTLGQFCLAAKESRATLQQLAQLAALYVPPVVHTTTVQTDAATEEQFHMLEPILPTLVKIIFKDGPLGDRSGAMFKTALILRDDGWLAQAVFTVLLALDARLGKFVGREDREERLMDIVRKVGL